MIRDNITRKQRFVLNRDINLLLTYHEKRRGEIESYEVDPQVDAQSESGDCRHGGREVA